MRKIKKRTWEEQFEHMVKHREKENEKQTKEFLKKNGNIMKAIYKTDKISDIMKILNKSNRAENEK